MTVGKQAARGSAWTMGQIVLERTVQAVVFLLIATRLGPSGFGKAAIAVAPAIILGASVQASSQVYIRRHSEDDTYIDAAYTASLALGFLATVIILLAAFSTTFLYRDSLIALMMASTAVVPLFYGFAVVPETVLFSRMQFAALALRRSMAVLVAGALCVVVAYTKYAPWALVIQLLVNSLTATSISVALAGVPFRPSANMKAALIMARLSSPALGTALLTQLSVRGVDMALGGFAGVAAAGLYRMVRTILDLVTSLFFNPIANVLVPVLSTSIADPGQLTHRVRKTLSITILMMSVVYVGVVGSLPLLAPLVLSHSRQTFVDVGLALSPTMLSSAVIGVCHSSLVSIKKAERSFTLTFWSALVLLGVVALTASRGLMLVCLCLSAVSWATAALYVISTANSLAGVRLLGIRTGAIIATCTVIGQVCNFLVSSLRTIEVPLLDIHSLEAMAIVVSAVAAQLAVCAIVSENSELLWLRNILTSRLTRKARDG